MEAGIKQAAAWTAQARRILFITGAGISAESGLPTYRGISGLYNNQTTPEGFPIEVALSGPMLKKRPEITWRHLAAIEEACRGASFNQAHRIIAQMEERGKEVLVLTQNIDGFHQQAGSKNLVDIHGDIHLLYCTRCSFRERRKDYQGLKLPPLCPKCSAPVRPDVVFFEEMLPLEKLQKLDQEMRQGFDLVYSIGTTSVFPYIAAPVQRARSLGVPTVEINPGESEVSFLVSLRLQMGARDALEQIWKEAFL